MSIERSTQHSPRIDDEMAAETASLTHGAPVEAHAEEWRSQESPADGEPAPESVVEFAQAPVGGGIDDNERRRRSELAAALPGHAFPGDRGRLLHAAEAEHAPEWVIDALGTLPIDTRFDTPQDVWSALGGHRESRVSEPEPVETSAPQVEPAREPIAPSRTPSPPAGLDLVARLTGIAGLGVEIASAVVGGTVHLARRVLGSLRR
ncbi:MAG TPA: DUF2795 domain-containing protein [Acidimicrobiia bacterium]|nr:DUF2795 domain-containing protein [Acidimicrobiia bacterium]